MEILRVFWTQFLEVAVYCAWGWERDLFDLSSDLSSLFRRQVTCLVPFSEDIVFEAGPFSAAFSVSGDKFTAELSKRRNDFDTKFEEKFDLVAKVEDSCVGSLMYLQYELWNLIYLCNVRECFILCTFLSGF